MSERAIRSVAVVGGGIVAFSAALAFRKALPNAVVTVLETPVNPAALADRMPTTWPSVGQFHGLIGLDELDLVRRGIAVHHVGTVFQDWPDGRNWVHGFGRHGKPVVLPCDVSVVCGRGDIERPGGGPAWCELPQRAARDG